MIVLHRLGHEAEPFHLNPDMILTVEALPDTVITLTSGTKIVVVEPPARVADEVRAWRVGILRDALERPRDAPAEAAPPLRLASRTEDSPPQADHSG